MMDWDAFDLFVLAAGPIIIGCILTFVFWLGGAW
jgi:hypothetical protein